MNNYINKISKQNWLIIVLTYGAIVSFSLILYGYIFPSQNNFIEVPPVMALLEPELFKNDFYVRDTLQITPRYYYQYLIYLVAKTGLGLVGAYFFCYLLSFSSFVLGLYTIGKRVGRSKLSAAVLVFLGLFTAGGTVGYVSLYRTEPIPAVLAMGLTIWGFYFCFAKRWILGYLFFGLASLIQFLVGVLPGMMMAPVLVLDTWKNRNFWRAILPFLILGVLASFVYLPMTISGNANSGIISDREFVYLYGYLRQPHHIILSDFPHREWRNFIFLTLGGILSIANLDSWRSQDKRQLLLPIIVSYLMLLVGYIFVEIYPIALVAKLQFARTTPFVQLISLIGLSVLVNEQYRQRNIALCVLLLMTPVVRNGGTLLFLVVVVFTILKATNRLKIVRNRAIAGIIIVGLLLFIALYPPTSSISVMLERVVWKFNCFLIFALSFLAEEFLEIGRKIKTKIYFIAITLWLFLLLALLNFLPRKIAIYSPKDEELTRLALRFREHSTKDALVLTPPSLTQFRFYSQRSVVFTFYSSPYTEKGLKEWANRLNAIAGTISPPLSWRNIDSFYSKRNSSELVQIAKQYGADYILTRSEWHSNINGTVFDREGNWMVYKIDEKKN
jgi:hypothetical protein